MSSDDDCRGCIRLKFRTIRRRDARTAIRMFVAIVARRPNRIAEARYISDIPFLSPGLRQMDATDGCVRCAHRHARYFRETALRYCTRVHVSAMHPSSIVRNIVRYRRVLYFDWLCICIYIYIVCTYTFVHMHTYMYTFCYVREGVPSSFLIIPWNFSLCYIRIWDWKESCESSRETPR